MKVAVILMLADAFVGVFVKNAIFSSLCFHMFAYFFIEIHFIVNIFEEFCIWNKILRRRFFDLCRFCLYRS